MREGITYKTINSSTLPFSSLRNNIFFSLLGPLVETVNYGFFPPESSRRYTHSWNNVLRTINVEKESKMKILY